MKTIQELKEIYGNGKKYYRKPDWDVVSRFVNGRIEEGYDYKETLATVEEKAVKDILDKLNISFYTPAEVEGYGGIENWEKNQISKAWKELTSNNLEVKYKALDLYQTILRVGGIDFEDMFDFDFDGKTMCAGSCMDYTEPEDIKVYIRKGRIIMEKENGFKKAVNKSKVLKAMKNDYY